MFTDPLRDYKKMANQVKNYQKKHDHIKALDISLEAISLLPSAYNLSVEKNIELNNFIPLDYTCKYLAILQKESEIEELKKIINKIDHPDLENRKSYFFLKNYNIIGEIKNYINQNEKISFEKLNEKFELGEKELTKILKTAEKIDLIEFTNHNNKKMIKNKNCNSTLRNLLSRKRKKNNNGLFKKITSVFK